MLQGTPSLKASKVQREKRNRSARVPSPQSRPSSSPLNRIATPSPIESPVSSPSSSPQIKPTNTPVAANRPVVLAIPEASSPLPASAPKHTQRGHQKMLIVAGVLSGAFVLLISGVAFAFFRSNKVVTVKPWATGLSGQLQKALVTGQSSFYR